MVDLVGSIQIGELGDRVVEVRESITDLTFNLSARGVSEIQMTVSDPGFRMHNANYFMVGRSVKYADEFYEMAAVRVRHNRQDVVQVQARLKATEELRREKGQYNFGNVSPTAFASALAARKGLDFFGEETIASGNIIRNATDNSDESTWDVLQKLARENEFFAFEAQGVLFFASEQAIIDSQPGFTLNVPSGSNDAFFASDVNVRRTQDGRSAATLSADLLKNSSSLSVFPGAVVQVVGLNNFDKFMVDQMTYNAQPSQLVRMSATAVEDTPDMGCSSQTFQFGARNECVKRIQIAVNTIVDGWWGPVTQRAVLAFQTRNGLTADGIVGPSTWAVIEAL